MAAIQAVGVAKAALYEQVRIQMATPDSAFTEEQVPQVY